MDEVELRALKVKPDFIVLTETWLDESTPDSSISIANYTISRRDRNRFGGGIIIYSPNGLPFQVLNGDDYAKSLNSCDSEMLHCYFLVLTFY